jgi:hypothetical protein
MVAIIHLNDKKNTKNGCRCKSRLQVLKGDTLLSKARDITAE